LKSSDLEIDPALRGEARVIEICKLVGATGYVNPPGGERLYSSDNFKENGMTLTFIQPSVLEEKPTSEVDLSSVLSFVAHYGFNETITAAKTGFTLK